MNLWTKLALLGLRFGAWICCVFMDVLMSSLPQVVFVSGFGWRARMLFNPLLPLLPLPTPLTSMTRMVMVLLVVTILVMVLTEVYPV